jgi:hypothetical protein
MAACSSERDEENKDINLEEFKDLQCDIDELEALKDLEELLISDDELYVDLDDTSSPKNDRDGETESEHGERTENPTGSTACASNLVCGKCKKVYKRQKVFDKHTKSCTGKRKKLSKGTTKGKRKHESSATTDHKQSK